MRLVEQGLLFNSAYYHVKPGGKGKDISGSEEEIKEGSKKLVSDMEEEDKRTLFKDFEYSQPDSTLFETVAREQKDQLIGDPSNDPMSAQPRNMDIAGHPE